MLFNNKNFTILIHRSGFELNPLILYGKRDESEISWYDGIAVIISLSYFSFVNSYRHRKHHHHHHQ